VQVLCRMQLVKAFVIEIDLNAKDAKDAKDAKEVVKRNRSVSCVINKIGWPPQNRLVRRLKIEFASFGTMFEFQLLRKVGI